MCCVCMFLLLFAFGSLNCLLKHKNELSVIVTNENKEKKKISV